MTRPVPAVLVVALAEHNDALGARIAAGTRYRTPPERALELDASGAVRMLESVPRVSWGTEDGRILSPFTTPSHYEAEPTDGGLTSLQLTQYDPGSAAYRYHSAANAAGHGRSAFARYGHANPHCDLRQYDVERSSGAIGQLFDSADVIHTHMDYSMLGILGKMPRHDQLLVRHYHGSHVNPADPKSPRVIEHEVDDELGAVQLGARLYHNRFSSRVHWLPIPVPFWDYHDLAMRQWQPRDARHNKCWRIAHSPTNARVKGTMILECAVNDLRARGVPVELVLIEGKSHGDALALKATCDITFDSFWLGIQGSGLEAAAMGQVVIAGDPDVKAEYEAFLGYCPYTYAYGFDDIGAVIERVITDTAFATEEAARVKQYTLNYHDYLAVGARYWRILAHERATRQQQTTEAFGVTATATTAHDGGYAPVITHALAAAGAQ